MLVTLEQARTQILDRLAPLAPETCDLLGAVGRVLTTPLVAQRALPAFDNSAMDGYAVRAADTTDATDASPRRLRLVGESAAGGAWPETTVGPGEAMRIFTGAPLPEGADAVVPQEVTRQSDGGVDILVAHEGGDNVRRTGEDVTAGTVLLQAGAPLGPPELAMLAAQGRSFVDVHRRPRVAIVPTGSEIVEVDMPLERGQVVNSNSLQLAAQVRLAGGEPIRFPPVADDPEALRQALLDAAATSDLVVTSGGVSVGEHDLVRKVVGELGTLHFWRVAIKPGKPVAFGELGGTPLLGLPGNPVSAYVCFELFGRPALRRLAGHASPLTPLRRARLARTIEPNAKRLELLRAEVHWRGDEPWVEPFAKQGSGQLSSMTGAAVLVLVPSGDEALPEGTALAVMPLGYERESIVP